MKTQSLASILINNYNYGRFLKDAIDSALAQTYSYKEIIVVDDGSTDNSKEVISNYGSQIIPVFKENGGQTSAFNAGFAICRGQVIFFLDADDIFIKTKVAEVINVFEKYPNIGWSFHPQTLVNKNKEPIIQKIQLGLSQVHDFRAAIKRGKLNPLLPSWKLPATSAFSFRRELLEQILPMPEIIKITSDDYLKFSALGLSSGFIIEQELSQQRIHGNNAFTLKEDKDKDLVKAKVNVYTAYWLKINFPHLSKFANNIFATGLCLYRKHGLNHDEISEIINKYLSSLSLLEKLELRSRILYHRIKVLTTM